MGELDGRRAVVTGGASGIGLAAAAQLLAAGWKVAITDIGDAALAEVRQGLGRAPGVRVKLGSRRYCLFWRATSAW